jgi:hypothetical protein
MSTAIAEVEPMGGVLGVIERAALNPDIDVEKMKALFELQERIMARKAEMAFNAGFAEMQSEMPVISERGEIKGNDGKVRSTFAFFEDINDAIKPVLQKHGFAIMFKTGTTKDSVSVTPILVHRDGHREVGEAVELGADTSGSKNSVQSIGSSMSYAKRYGLLALLNITTRGEDDDGFAGGAKLIDENQEANIQALLDEAKFPKDKLLKWISTKVKRQLTTLNQIPASQYADTIAGLEKKRNAAPEKGGK